MKKRIITVLMASLLAMNLCACGGHKRGYDPKEDPDYQRVYDYYRTGKWK